MKKDINNLIEELTKVNPSNLSEEGLKLFNKINGIINRKEELEENNNILRQQNITYKRNIYDLKHNSIPVSLVEEKIEELKKLKFGVDLVTQSTANLTTICILQELLEKRK